MYGQNIGYNAEFKENIVNTVKAAFFASADWFYLGMFVLMISKSSSSMGHIEGKSVQHSADFIFYFSILRLCHVFFIRNFIEKLGWAN